MRRLIFEHGLSKISFGFLPDSSTLQLSTYSFSQLGHYIGDDKVLYEDAETESSTENEAIEFTPKELQSLDQGKIKRELERDSRNEGSGKHKDVDFSIGQTVELDHKPNVIPKSDRTKKIIQVEDGSDYWEREKLQPLEKVQEKDIVQNKVEPKEEKRVKKLIYHEDPEKIQITEKVR